MRTPKEKVKSAVDPIAGDRFWAGNPIKILIIEERGLWRGALALTLANRNFEVIELPAFMPAATQTMPLDVVIIDIHQLVGNGFPTIPDLISQNFPGCAVIALVNPADPVVSRGLSQIMRYVKGLFNRESSLDQLIADIRQVVSGGQAIDSELVAEALQAPPSPLTGREMEILGYLRSGAPTKEIAEILHLSAGTVRNYIRGILHKLNARTRIEAIRIAEESGWLV